MLAILRATDSLERVVITSLEAFVLRRLRRLEPELRTGLGITEVTEFLLNSRSTREYRPAGGHLQIPAWLATPSVIERSHRAGLSVTVFTLDDEDRWRALIDRGVDGLITNRPADLARFLDR